MLFPLRTLHRSIRYLITSAMELDVPECGLGPSSKSLMDSLHAAECANHPLVLRAVLESSQLVTFQGLLASTGDHVFQNIMGEESPGSQRFLFYSDGRKGDGRRLHMTLKELAERGRGLYCYGEPVSKEWPIYKQIISELESKLYCGKDLTSCLLWISLHGSVSPLHYDLTEGILFQSQGVKDIYLFPPSDSLENMRQFRPYPVSSRFDRQSQCSSLDSIPLPRYKCSISAGDALYIPFGWWHQIVASAEEANVSISLRWNPYEEQILAINASTSLMPIFAKDLIFSAILPERISKLFEARNRLDNEELIL